MDALRSRKALLSIFTLSAAVAIWLLSRTTRRAKRKIQEEVVVIVGASSGVGLEVARLYAKSWQRQPQRKIHIIARRPEIRIVTDEVESSTGCKTLVAHVANACSEEGIAGLFQEILQSSGKVDTLIFCAGALTTLAFTELGSPSDGLDRPERADRGVEERTRKVKDKTMTNIAKASYDANVLSCMNTISKLLPLLQLSSRPRIAVLSSVAAEIPAPTRSIYAAHKAALSMFLRCLRIELDSLPVGNGSHGPCRGIGISIIHPASINTGLRGKSLDSRGSASDTPTGHTGPQEYERSAMSPEYVAAEIKRAVDFEIDEMWLPGLYWWVAKVGMVVAPDFIARKAKKKYEWSS